MIRPRGELDIASAGELRTSLLTALSTTDGGVLVDCSGVTFIDSTALGVLAAASKRLRAAGHRLRMVCVAPPVGRAIQLAGLTDYLGVQSHAGPEG